MPTIDEYSVSTVPIEMHFDAAPLSVGTSFVFEAAGGFFLISNWHNFSGRDPVTNKHLSPSAAEPNRLRAWWNVKGKLGNKFAAFLPLLDPNGDPLWWVHSTFGRAIDIAVLPLAPDEKIDFHPINHMASKPLASQIGLDVFILGYPFGIGAAGLPIWKRASIASEPDIPSDTQRYILVDTASRPGMSGSPVIIRSRGTHILENGNAELSTGPATRFLGIYSGRLSTKDQLDAQLGMVWPAKFIGEIINGRTRDTR